MSNAPRILYHPRADTSSKEELDALAAVYKFVLFDSQTSKGGLHDLIRNSSKRWMTRPDKKGQNADVHRNGL